MSWIKTLGQAIKSAFTTARPPAPQIPAVLLICEAAQRPGLSAMSLASTIISRLPEADIPTGVNPDGSENINNRFIKIVSEEVVKHIKDCARIDFAINSGDIVMTGTGGNAGGPLEIISQNTNISSENGIVI